MPLIFTVFFIFASSSISMLVEISTAALAAVSLLSTGGRSSLNRRNRRALVTTHTLDRLMAAAANIGLSSTPRPDSAPAATGMPIRL